MLAPLCVYEIEFAVQTDRLPRRCGDDRVCKSRMVLQSDSCMDDTVAMAIRQRYEWAGGCAQMLVSEISSSDTSIGDPGRNKPYLEATKLPRTYHPSKIRLVGVVAPV